MNDRNWFGRAWLAAIGALVLCGSAAAQYACESNPAVGAKAGERPFDNPCPVAGDVILPMPGGELFMVFRSVPVPGESFWGEPERTVYLGDPDARIFEGRRAVSVAGSFVARGSKNWQMLIGKYEVSLAQFATVFGKGDIDRGLQVISERLGGETNFADLIGGSASDAERRRQLAAPVRGMRLRDYEAFVQEYTDWCYGDAGCRRLMPRFGDAPGFFRLPTEIEWEYAARKGAEPYESGLPFDAAKAGDFAYVTTGARSRERPTSIGRLEPTRFEIYDLYGNVSELADGRFYAELGQGKPGMSVARGGSYADQPSDLRASLREETQGYRTEANGRLVPLQSERLGIRLAIGSQVVADAETYGEIEKAYAEYRSTDRLLSPSGRSTQADLLTAAEPLARIDGLVEDMARRNPLEVEALQEIVRETEEARLALIRTTESLASQLSRNAIRDSAEAGRSRFRLTRIEASLAKAREPGQSERVRAQIPRLEAQYDSYAEAAETSLDIYVTGIQRLASYGEFAETAINALARQEMNPRDEIALRLARQHLKDFLDGGADPESWKEDVREAFNDEGLFGID